MLTSNDPALGEKQQGKLTGRCRFISFKLKTVESEGFHTFFIIDSLQRSYRHQPQKPSNPWNEKQPFQPPTMAWETSTWLAA